MNRELQLSKILKEYKSSIAISMDDNDVISLYLNGKAKDIIEMMASSVLDCDREKTAYLRTAILSTTIALITSNEDDMRSFFSDLNEAISKQDNSTAKIIDINKYKK